MGSAAEVEAVLVGVVRAGAPGNPVVPSLMRLCFAPAAHQSLLTSVDAWAVRTSATSATSAVAMPAAAEAEAKVVEMQYPQALVLCIHHLQAGTAVTANHTTAIQHPFLASLVAWAVARAAVMAATLQ